MSDCVHHPCASSKLCSHTSVFNMRSEFVYLMYIFYMRSQCVSPMCIFNMRSHCVSLYGFSMCFFNMHIIVDLYMCSQCASLIFVINVFNMQLQCVSLICVPINTASTICFRSLIFLYF